LGSEARVREFSNFGVWAAASCYPRTSARCRRRIPARTECISAPARRCSRRLAPLDLLLRLGCSRRWQGHWRLVECSKDRSCGDVSEWSEAVVHQPTARGARTRFGFDLGGELETVPFDRTSEQWSLYEPTGKVLALRADRCISYVRNETRPNAERWRKLAGLSIE
jgi:hypothetical protein